MATPTSARCFWQRELKWIPRTSGGRRRFTGQQKRATRRSARRFWQREPIGGLKTRMGKWRSSWLTTPTPSSICSLCRECGCRTHRRAEMWRGSKRPSQRAPIFRPPTSTGTHRCTWRRSQATSKSRKCCWMQGRTFQQMTPTVRRRCIWLRGKVTRSSARCSWQGDPTRRRKTPRGTRRCSLRFAKATTRSARRSWLADRTERPRIRTGGRRCNGRREMAFIWCARCYLPPERTRSRWTVSGCDRSTSRR
mmetsp:Transcript_14733/g.34179  ORF Transcript_14733/g.34179 Transcript_14733/m.34179 type:complete len:251 (+) Transcript_14733:641-1393(+)